MVRTSVTSQSKKPLLRNLKRILRQAVGLRRMRIDGVWIDLRSIKSRHVRSLILKEVYEFDERLLIKEFVKDDDIVVEIGAGIGLVGLICANIARNGVVHSFEANMSLEDVIKANYNINSRAPTITMRAVTNSGGMVRFASSADVLSSKISDSKESTGVSEVVSVSIHNVISQCSPTCLIVDVEGAEATLFEGVDLSGVRTIILELHERILGPEVCRKVVGNITESGFREAHRIGENICFVRDGQ